MTVKDNAEQGDTELSGKIDIVAYVDADNEREVRQHMNEVHDTQRFTEKEEVIEDDRDVKLYYDDTYVRLHNASPETIENMDTGDFEVKITGGKQHTTEWVSDLERVLDNMVLNTLDDMVGDVLDESYRTRDMFGVQLLDPNRDRLFSVHSKQQSMRLLKTQENMTEDDLFVESDEEYEVMVFSFKLKKLNEQQFDRVNTIVIPEFIEQVAEADWIDVMRTYNCKVEETEKGVCWNI